MNKLLFFTLVAVTVAGCDELPEARLDAGGVSFDLAGYSAKRFRVPKTGEAGNLMPADLKWRGHYDEVHHEKVPGTHPLRKEVGRFITYTEKDGERAVGNGEGLRTLSGPMPDVYKHVSGSWVSRLKLPDAKGGTYRVTCNYQINHRDQCVSYPGGVLIWFYGHDEAGKEIRTENRRYECWVFPEGWGDWQLFSRTFTIAEGTDTLDLHVRLDGLGDMKFRDFGIEKVKPAKPLSVKMLPHGLFDSTCALALGQAQMICYGWKKENKNDTFEEKRFRFTLTLPKGVRYLADGSARPKTREVTELPDGSTRIAFVPALDPVCHRAPGLTYTGGDKFSFLVKNTNPAPWKGEGVLEVTYDGKRIADAERTEFYTVEPLAAQKPKDYHMGVIGYGKMDHFGDEGDREYVKTLTDCGINLIIGSYNTPERLAIWREAGIRTILDYSFMADGYLLGSGRNRPENERFVADRPVNNTWKNMVERDSTCPYAVIEEMPFFKTNTVPRILASVKGMDGAWTNWEPFMYKGYGCACERCKKHFAEWKQANPGGTVEKFRSLAHAKMVKTLDKYVKQGSGGEKSWGFVAGVSWRETCSAWKERHPSIESEPIDYAADMKWLEPWGPYCYCDPTVPYNYDKRGPLAHFIAAKDIRETTDADFPLPKRPKLMSFPHGMQCGTWFTQPERLGMACDSFFFNGFEANTVYFFPEGYDARFLKAVADASTHAAKYEDFVFRGVRRDDMTRLELVPEYATPCPIVTTYMPKYKDVPLLQQATYEKDGRRIIAVFNFWEEGEAFFTLRTLGLGHGDCEIVDEEGTRWFKGDVSKGSFLMVGAARMKVFEVRKTGTEPRAVHQVSAEHLRKYYDSRKAELGRLAAENAKKDGKPVKTDTRAEL